MICGPVSIKQQHQGLVSNACSTGWLVPQRTARKSASKSASSAARGSLMPLVFHEERRPQVLRGAFDLSEFDSSQRFITRLGLAVGRFAFRNLGEVRVELNGWNVRSQATRTYQAPPRTSGR